MRMGNFQELSKGSDLDGLSSARRLCCSEIWGFDKTACEAHI